MVGCPPFTEPKARCTHSYGTAAERLCISVIRGPDVSPQALISAAMRAMMIAASSRGVEGVKGTKCNSISETGQEEQTERILQPDSYSCTGNRQDGVSARLQLIHAAELDRLISSSNTSRARQLNGPPPLLALQLLLQILGGNGVVGPFRIPVH